MKTSKNGSRNGTVASPAKHLASELIKLRAELRKTVRVYTARLEMQLAQSLAALPGRDEIDDLPRERVHQLRDLTAMVRKRKVKPEKGRRKDLRKIDTLINDLHVFLPNGSAQ